MIACRQLQKIIAQIRPEMQLQCMLDTVEESVEYLNDNQPDVIFMDVELGDGTCFDIFRQIDVVSPVIFITAYSKYAIDSFAAHTVDYLLKPVNPQSVRQALDKLEEMRAMFQNSGGCQPSPDPQPNSGRILIVKHSVISYLNISDVAFFKFEDRYINAYTIDGRCEITEMKNVSEVMECIQGYDFFQLSRGIIASINAIRKVKKIDSHRIMVEIGAGDNVLDSTIISMQRRKSFLQWLGK